VFKSKERERERERERENVMRTLGKNVIEKPNSMDEQQ
jgi:hypothetical protein